VIVELIGCAGAGKSTLARMLCEHGVAGGRAVAMPDLVLDRPGLRRITHPTAVNLAQDLSALPFLLAGGRRHGAFVRFAAGALVRHAPSAFHKANGVRSIVRRVGMYELARRRAASRVVLADEGTVLTAYHVFVLAALEFGPDELERFAHLVPLPDRIVYVRAPVASLVGRAATRGEGRRQLPPLEIDRVEATIRRTVDLFDLLVTAAPLRDRVLIVDNDDGDDIRRRRLVAAIAARLEAEAPGATAVDHESLRLRAEPRS
jgi:hypothetical protein